eukprot:Skav224037  [mRNA]  locus=scaffold2030:12199:21058:- [translate_table: standard]
MCCFASCLDLVPVCSTPLHLASAHGHEDGVNWLVAKASQLDAATEDGRKTPGDLATENGQSEIVKILEAARLQEVNFLMSSSMIYWLIELICTDRDSADEPAIFEAATAGDLPAVRGLIRADPDAVRRTNQYGQTPLHVAAGNGSAAAVAQLLELRAAVHAVTNEGRTPLHCAAYDGELEAARLLLGAKADVRAKGRDGMTPLDEAKQKGHSDVVRLLQDVAWLH